MALNTLASLRSEGSTQRRCGSCAFYQVSPLRQQGWCRNPQIHQPHERALVSYDEHRCLKMLTDFWHPAPNVSAKTTGGRPVRGDHPGFFATLSRFALPAPVLYGIVVLVVAIAAAVVFSTQTTRATNDARTSRQVDTAIAKLDFWLRDDSRTDARKKSIVLIGTQLELIDSKAGEMLDDAADTPAKWYKVKVAISGETGWVYSAWLSRPKTDK